AGIYRHVWLNKTAPLHLVPDGIRVRSELAEDHASARVIVDATLTNAGRADAGYRVEFALHGPEAGAAPLARMRAESESPLSPGVERTQQATFVLPSPQLWDLDSPHLHTLVTSVYQGDALIDRVQTRFGIRSLRFDPNHGFFLNGRHVIIKGT